MRLLVEKWQAKKVNPTEWSFDGEGKSWKNVHNGINETDAHNGVNEII